MFFCDKITSGVFVFSKSGFLPVLNKIPALLLCSIVTLFCLLISAKSVQQFGLWTRANVTGPILNSEKVQYLFNPEIRLGNDHSAFVRLGLGYEESKFLSFWVTYDWYEYRLWQQMILETDRCPYVYLSIRTRVEQRKRVDERCWAHRLRQQFALQFPEVFDKYGFVIWEEIFFHLNTVRWLSNRTISQNRFFVGLEVPISKHTLLDIGYLNRYRFEPDVNIMSHIFYLSFNIEF